MKLSVEQLEDSGYVLLSKFKHDELVKFLNEKNAQNKTYFFYIFIITFFSSIILLSFFSTLFISTSVLTIANCGLHFIIGLMGVFIFIPLRKLLQALTYKMLGAKNITFVANIKDLSFVTLSDKNVINLLQFKIVALTPFLFVIVLAIILGLFVTPGWFVSILTFVLVHNLFCVGNFSLLNFMQSNKEKGIVTYDVVKDKETYFYIKK